MKKTIKLIMFSNPKEISALIESPLGISAEITPPTMAFDCGIDIDRAYEIVVSIASGISSGIIANYIYSKISQKNENSATIGNITINAKNISVNQIINIIESDKAKQDSD